MEQKYSTIKTLSFEEVRIKLHKDGPNTIPLHIWDLILMSIKNLRTPIILINLSILIISLILQAYFEAFLISILIMLQFILSIFDMSLISKYLFKRDKFNPPLYKSLREDQTQQIKKQDLVEGDIVILKAGDMVPADCEIIKAEDLSIDESLISGNSFPVIKVAPKNPRRHNDPNKLYAHTYLVSGNAVVRIIKIGSKVKYAGLISKKLYQKQLSELDLRSNRTLNLIMLFMLLLIMLFILLLLIAGTEFNTISLLLIMSLIISTIPTLFPLLSSLSLLRLILALNKQGFSTLDLNSFEKLAQVDMLCFDKSGTLTTNQLEVIDYDTPIKEDLFLNKLNESSIGSNDAFDLAIQRLLQTKKIDFNRDLDYIDHSFDPYLKNSSRKFSNYTIVKGSPEQVLSELQIKDNLDLALKIKTRTQIGERIISLIEIKGKKVEYLGTVFFKDEIKHSVKEEIELGKDMGVNGIMISGDNLNTCIYVGMKTGLIESTDQAIEASQLQYDSPKILKSQLEKYKVIARANPIDKYKILEVLETDHNLAFLGEGINDIPCLKISHIAIVNEQSNELIKKYSDILVDKKDLSLILQAIFSMRGLIISLRKYIEIALVSGFSLLFSTFTLLLLSKTIPINPSQILVLEIIFFIAALQFISKPNNKGIPFVSHNFGIREGKMVLFALIFIGICLDIISYLLIQNWNLSYFKDFWFLTLGVRNIIFIQLINKSQQGIKTMILELLKLVLFISMLLIPAIIIFPIYTGTSSPIELHIIALISGLAYAIVLIIIRKFIRQFLNLN